MGLREVGLREVGLISQRKLVRGGNILLGTCYKVCSMGGDHHKDIWLIEGVRL